MPPETWNILAWCRSVLVFLRPDSIPPSWMTKPSGKAALNRF